jgi:hypothetical protein
MMGLFTAHELEILKLGDAAEDIGGRMDLHHWETSGPTARRIYEFLRTRKMARTGEIAAATGLNYQHTCALLSDAAKAGYLRRISRGLYRLPEEPQ